MATKIVLGLAMTTMLLMPISGSIAAQSPSIATGVVTGVEVAENGDLIAFSIIDGGGNTLRFTVSSSDPNTAYGLENRVSERWVSDQESSPREAAERLRDQQSRLTQVSVQSNTDNVAISVVQAQSTDVATNLGYVFAVVAIAWVGIMGYVVYMGVRQRNLSSELSRLRGDNGDNEA